METQSRHDLKINGAGNTAGGKFNDVIINGVGDINGDVDCINFKSNGASSIIGNLNSKATKINGSTSIRGELNSDELKVNGSAEINGTINVKESKVNGEVKLNGNMKADSVELHGWMKIAGDCNRCDRNSSTAGVRQHHRCGSAGSVQQLCSEGD